MSGPNFLPPTNSSAFPRNFVWGFATAAPQIEGAAFEESTVKDYPTSEILERYLMLGVRSQDDIAPTVAKRCVKRAVLAPMRAAAAKKLALDPDPETAKALVTATQDKNWMVRVAALEAIAERGDRSLISKVAPALDDDKDDVRYSGAACIARLSALPAKQRVTVNALASAAVAAN